MNELPPEEDLPEVVNLLTVSDEEREFVENFLVYAKHLDAIGSKKHIAIDFAAIELEFHDALQSALAKRGADAGAALSEVLAAISKIISNQLADTPFVQVVAYQHPTDSPKELVHVDYTGEYVGIKPGKLLTNWDDVLNQKIVNDGTHVLDQNGQEQFIPRLVIKTGNNTFVCVPITTIMAVFRASDPRHGMHLV